MSHITTAHVRQASFWHWTPNPLETTRGLNVLLSTSETVSVVAKVMREKRKWLPRVKKWVSTRSSQSDLLKMTGAFFNCANDALGELVVVGHCVVPSFVLWCTLQAQMSHVTQVAIYYCLSLILFNLADTDNRIFFAAKRACFQISQFNLLNHPT